MVEDAAAVSNPSSTPSTNAVQTPDPPAPELPPKPVREMARVLFPYSAQQPDELELRDGDLVIIHSRDCEDKGWWKGEINNKVSCLIEIPHVVTNQ